jgi:hypothetical protein
MGFGGRTKWRSLLAAVLTLVLVLACQPWPTSLPLSNQLSDQLSGQLPEGASVTLTNSTSAIAPPLPFPLSDVAEQFRNPWPPELETAFWERADQAIQYYADREYGNTFQENEKRSYPFAMFDFLAGNRERAIAFLQQEDNQAEAHAHTEGIDYYFSFTLKGQMRKYFLFGDWLDPAYRQRMFAGAQQWTAQDPAAQPHPVYGRGDGSGPDWSIQRRGYQVDRRNTDNLRAMRETSVYLMAEETGNEAVRQLYKQKLQRYVWALYHIGMGEWDSANYHGHTFAAYLNLYDFARDPEVTALAKAALDWLSTAAAVKYVHGGWAGPTKRDHDESNQVFGAAAASLFWHYFGDVPLVNPSPERDAIHVITSAYRPPLAVVALAHRQFDRPLELLSSKPTYENWLPGGSDRPAYWEATYFGHTYQMGSVVSSFADGDVGPFKLLADSADRGVNFFVANTGEERVRMGKRSRDQLGQCSNLLVWLRPADEQNFLWQLPRSAWMEREDGFWFFRLEQTWLALHPVHLRAYRPVPIADEELAEFYSREQILRSGADGTDYAGFALEVGEPETHGSYQQFKQRVKQGSILDLTRLDQGLVQFTGSNGNTLHLTHNPDNDLPLVRCNGDRRIWDNQFAPYDSGEASAPVTQVWHSGRLRVSAGGEEFTAELF